MNDKVNLSNFVQQPLINNIQLSTVKKSAVQSRNDAIASSDKRTVTRKRMLMDALSFYLNHTDTLENFNLNFSGILYQQDYKELYVCAFIVPIEISESSKSDIVNIDAFTISHGGKSGRKPVTVDAITDEKGNLYLVLSLKNEPRKGNTFGKTAKINYSELKITDI